NLSLNTSLYRNNGSDNVSEIPYILASPEVEKLCNRLPAACGRMLWKTLLKRQTRVSLVQNLHEPSSPSLTVFTASYPVRTLLRFVHFLRRSKQSKRYD